MLGEAAACFGDVGLGTREIIEAFDALRWGCCGLWRAFEMLGSVRDGGCSGLTDTLQALFEDECFGHVAMVAERSLLAVGSPVVGSWGWDGSTDTVGVAVTVITVEVGTMLNSELQYWAATSFDLIKHRNRLLCGHLAAASPASHTKARK